MYVETSSFVDETVYSEVPGIPDFVQMEPEAGSPATEKTELWIRFDDRNVYVAFGGSTGGDTPILFYSRQIGINSGSVVPIQSGERLKGRIGLFSLGALHMKTDDQPAAGTPGTDFSVVRLKRDLLRRSSVGMIFTMRAAADGGSGINEAMGYGFQLERLAIGADFNPEIGFVRRNDIRKSFAQFRFSPRPPRLKSVRKCSAVVSAMYIKDFAPTASFAPDFVKR